METASEISRVTLSDKWLKSQGYHRHGGNSIEPILPFCVLDEFQLEFGKVMTTVENISQCKKIAKAAAWEYHKLNSEFFRAYTKDEQDAVMDIFDAFEDWIAKDLLVVKVQVMNLLTDLTFDQQGVCASLTVCNILCQCASIIWGHCYRTPRGNKARKQGIEALERLTSRLTDTYHSSVSGRRVDPNESEVLCKAVDILCRKIIRFLSEPENMV